jgi:hypothetical protein
MKQNLFWASIYNLLAIPIAAGVLFPHFGIMLRPEWSALLMSVSSIIVATNAVLLKRVDHELGTTAPLVRSRIGCREAFGPEHEPLRDVREAGQPHEVANGLGNLRRPHEHARE